LIIGGYLCIYGFASGWPSIFYLIGIVSLIWVGVMLLTFSSSPSNNRFIGSDEKHFIIQKTQIKTHNEKMVNYSKTI
jgi:hypothetical protein